SAERGHSKHHRGRLLASGRHSTASLYRCRMDYDSERGDQLYRWYRPDRRAFSARMLTVAFSLVFLLSLFLSAPAQAAARTTTTNAASAKAQSHKPITRNALKHDTTPKLKTMKPSKAKAQSGKAKTVPAPAHPVPHGKLN